MARTMAFLAGLLAVSFVWADGDAVDYERDVRHLLKERCWACHGALQQQSDLRLDTAALMVQGGDSGPAVVPGKPEESLLLERVSEPDEFLRMPPEGAPLTPEQIAAISRWIAEGARAPADEVPEPDPDQHWAFQQPKRPPVPDVSSTDPVSNPIDAFLLQAMEHRGLTPRPPAEKATLLRRVTLDLIGVPPTPEELHAFLADASPTAYETVVDRLLHDPRHGERWARHWLDIWRYSDWYGRRNVPDVWNSAPQIWRWRDWAVRSLNDDLGYDDMLRMMLAGDEIAPEDDESVVATGYLIRNWYALNPNDWMRNTVEHTGKAFLGLTFNCAHCHDHKYDPILHDDYFRFRAWFEPIYIRQDRLPGEPDPGPFQDYKYSTLRKIQREGLVRIFDKDPEAPTWFYTGGDERNRVTERGSISPGIPAFLPGEEPEIEPVSLPPRGYYPGLRPEIQETLRADLQAALDKAEADVAAARPGVEENSPLVREQLAAAQAALETALAEARQDGQPGALEGQQSLLLDAVEGRRILNNSLDRLQSFPDGLTIEFRWRILNDAHCNFQLARDTAQGLTAGFVAFDQGRILSYQPGSTTQFEAGRYDWEAGQQQFRVSLRLDPAADEAELRVVCESDETVLVDGTRIALNGWNPVGNPVQAITFDARTGSRVVVDAVRLLPPIDSDSAQETPPEPLLAYDFEEPTYPEGQDVADRDGWTVSRLSAAPGTSQVSKLIDSEPVQQAKRVLEQVQRQQQDLELPLQAAEARAEAARAKRAALEARIAAERARYGEVPEDDPAERASVASRLERQGNLAQAEADLLTRKAELLAAQAKPEEGANRAKEIDAATKAITAAQSAIEAARKALADESLAETYAPLTPTYPETSTGRRRALADWIASRDNPLTARVAVNHVWIRHFNQPLVETVYDFGRNGTPPSHPELLDWLAVEFMESGWSMRHLHRLIVTSRAYRRVSSAAEESSNLERDPDNRFLWRMNPSRMEAEIVRDSLLAVAGKLDLTMGGQELENDQALTTHRRSLYYATYPEDGGKNPLEDLFDGPSPLDCYRRTETIIPQQALALTNSELVHGMSAAIVRKWPPSVDGTGRVQFNEFIDANFKRILSRPPSEEERQLCLETAREQLERLTAADVPEPELRVCESLVRVLFNHNDFVTIR